MFTFLKRLRRATAALVRPAAPPATALAILTALMVLEERGFNRDSALLLALVAAVAGAQLVPLGAMAFTSAALILQAFKVLPVVMVSGVLSYVAVPLALFFATLGYKGRHRWLLPAFAVAASGLIAVNWFNDGGTWINFVFGSQLYGRGSLRTGTYVFLVFGAFAAFNLAAVAAGLAANNVSRSRRAQLRAEAELHHKATQLAVEQERNRIARELHDVLAHSLTVITAQAEGIRYIHRSEPECVEESAQIIASAARTALVETRRMMEGPAPAGTRSAGSHTAQPGPAPSVQHLGELAAQFAGSGMPVAVDSAIELPGLTPLQDLTAYRLVQESLTNAFKHGDRPQGASVSVRPESGGLRVRVSSALADAGAAGRPAAKDARSGRGITGMKERATAVGGSLTAVATGNRFEVEALLP
ncbi:sensor histidine kinase [Pseudarthrobacter sp. N5]|uniref:sensor histidine kinase n=1 Tax=Pseudarthrobacter sp. N5 TaxID=3418416 RepID=UPI003CFA52D4